MTCRVIDQAEVIPKYLNDQLAPAARDDFEVHILECPECQDMVELFQRVREQLQARAHEIRTYRVARPSLWWSWAAVAACCVIVVVIGFRWVGGLHKLAEFQKGPHQIPAPTTASPPLVQTAGSGTSPSAPPARKQAGEAGSGNSHIAVTNAPGAASAGSGTSDSGTVQVAAGTEKNSQSANPNEVSTTGTPEVNKFERAGSDGKLTPEKGTAAESAVATNATSPTKTRADEIAQLAAVRALPYSFSGLAASQPAGGGVTRGSHSSASAVSGTTGTPQPGTSGSSTAQDYFRDGMTAYVERRYETAADLLGQAVRLDPEFGEANLYLGICALLQGKAGDAISPLQSASRQKKSAIAQAGHFYLAKAYLKLGQLADAEAELHAAAVLPGRLAGEANALVQRVHALQHADTNP